MHSLATKNSNILNIALALVLSLVTFGLYNLYWQYRQIEALNDMLQRPKYGFAAWLALTIVTCGFYHIYHEYRMSEDLARLCDREGRNDELVALVLCVLGLSIVTDAIQQTHINRFYGNDSL